MNEELLKKQYLECSITMEILINKTKQLILDFKKTYIDFKKKYNNLIIDEDINKKLKLKHLQNLGFQIYKIVKKTHEAICNTENIYYDLKEIVGNTSNFVKEIEKQIYTNKLTLENNQDVILLINEFIN